MSNFSLTQRFKVPVPTLNNTMWFSYMTHWAELMEVMYTVLANGYYVIDGLVVTSSISNLSFSYTGGSINMNGTIITVTSASGSLTAESFNWVYIQGGQVKVSTYPPAGLYVPIACLQTDVGGTIGNADLRPSSPTVSGISITPTQVNPSGNVNLAVSMRVIHADTNVGSNIVMFGNSQIGTVLSWNNQTVAIDWAVVNLSTLISSLARFAILNCYIATYNNANTNGWAILEVKPSSAYDNYVYNFVDYGHGSAVVLNPSQIGHANQIILPLTSDKKFLVRSLINNLGVTGTYYASIKLVGYII